jgi:alkylhydroperoxidase family enzyme
MTEFSIHTLESAPPDAKPVLEGLQKAYGQVPNLIGILAEAPVAAEAYVALDGLFRRSSFTPTERHVVWFTNNFENDCHYCMAAHTAIARSEKVAADVIEAARSGERYADPRLEALRHFTSKLVTSRGWPTEGEVQRFLDEGFAKAQILEILVGIAHKVLSNYTNHIATTPVDRVFERFVWENPHQ